MNPVVPTRGRHRAPSRFARLAPLTVGLAGLAVQLVGYWQGAHDRPGALTLFYLGLVVMVTPSAWVLVGQEASGRRRLATGCLLSMLLYLSYFLSSPLLATRFDETLHTSTLMSLLRGDGLFAPNEMLPVSPAYPGLELVTAAVRWLTGLPPVACEALVVAGVRLLLVTMLFLLAQRFSGSARVGGLVVLGYCASTQFYFFNAQFSYQTMAITLLVGIAFATRLMLETGPTVPRLALITALSAALAVTHHLTSWIAVGLGWLAVLVTVASGRRDRAKVVAIAVTPVTVATVAWTIVVGDLLTGYLGPLFHRAMAQLAAIFTGTTGPRTLFVDTSGVATPLWERAVMLVSILIWLGLLVAACWPTRERGVRWLTILAAATYPALLATKIAPTASEIADRASTFVFFVIAFIVARWAAPRLANWPQWTGAGVAVILLLGGLLLGGGPDWARVPGPYLPGAEQRSIDDTSVAAARWAGTHFPAGSRFAADTTMNRLIPNFAAAQPVTAVGGGANVSSLFYAPAVDRREHTLISDQRIDFVVVDTRLAGRRPRSGTFYESTSEFAGSRLSSAHLEKFAGTPGFELVYDGPVRIYDVRSIQAPLETTAALTPGSPVPWQAPAVLLVAAIPLLLRRKVGAERAVLLGLAAICGAIALGLAGVVPGFAPVIGLGLFLVALVALLRWA